MNVSQPVASSIGSISFGYLSDEEIKAISVKQIYVSETFDSLLNPNPGGVYDAALGAHGDYSCSTCHLGSFTCPGHPGHIELPVPIYNTLFFDQLLILLRGKCAYCHHLKLAPQEVHRYTCKLQLLRFGLINEAQEVDAMSATDQLGAPGSDNEPVETTDLSHELMSRRARYVARVLRQLGGKQQAKASMIEKVESLSGERRKTIKAFLRDIQKPRVCGSCAGISPKWRKDRFVKLFRVPLSRKEKDKMIQLEKKIINPLLAAAEAKAMARKERLEDRRVDEGIDVEMDDITDDEDQDIEMQDNEDDQAPISLVEDNATVVVHATKGTAESKKDEYVNPEEIHAIISQLLDKEKDLLSLVYNIRSGVAEQPSLTADMFFMRRLLVPPNKYRPEAYTAGRVTEDEMNSLYREILVRCESLHQIRLEMDGGELAHKGRRRSFPDFLNVWVALQDAVNSLQDSDRNPMQVKGNQQLPQGVKQVLEKKEGLFRKNMMGKRVNFAARSVISPDPNIETNQIGVPPVFAKKLTYPEPVTNANFENLKKLVLKGMHEWPGAAAIENENGQVISLRNKSFDERQALANMLLAPSNVSVNGAKNKKVHRHLQDNDLVIMNRQPTLHKPSMMCHKAKVLVGEKTIRMHYANCNTYNADFDGDEMNMHFPQNENARAEAALIADTDHQYLSATAGKPLRGLIQDHLSMAVWLTSRDTLFTRAEYHQLLQGGINLEGYAKMEKIPNDQRIKLLPPAIVKPRLLWTGKQVISTVLLNIVPDKHEGLTLYGKSQTPADRWGEGSEEGKVVFQQGELLCGILDKAHLGPSAGGFVHSVYEIYGEKIAGKLLSIMGRLLTTLLGMRAFSCGMEDIVLTKAGDITRRNKLKDADALGRQVAAKYVTLESTPPENDPELMKRIEDVLRDDTKLAGLDSVYNSRAAELSSELSKLCLPSGLYKSFPYNQMQTMTVSGAKGSSVNANLISCNLGQQVLEGRRVPIMASGKSLPSFRAFETSIRAGGYVTNRFLTGVRPQEYFFHTMAGREGLIDTAVKTARSGYLQRCLIKGMEGLKVEYDTSVRDSDGSMVQFLYGEDGLDVAKQKLLTDFKFQADNMGSQWAELGLNNPEIIPAIGNILEDHARKWNKKAIKQRKKTGRMDMMDPVLAEFNPGSKWGSTSELFAEALTNFVKSNVERLFKDKEADPHPKIKSPEFQKEKKQYTMMLDMKYLRSTVDPGEAVGIVAAQSIGEPSTQMTLNTFHLAGHSTKNVTLGIPRLREIVMTASTAISTPTMSLYLIPEVAEEASTKFAKGITKLTLAEVIDKVTVSETIDKGIGYDTAKIYTVRLDFYPSAEYQEVYAIQIADVLSPLERRFIPSLVKRIKKDLKAKDKTEAIGTSVKRVKRDALSKKNEIGNDEAEEEGNNQTAETAADHDRAQADVDSADENDPDDDATQFKQKNRGADAYEAPDDEEEAIAKRARAESLEPEDGDSEDEGYGGSPEPESKADEAGRNAARKREDRVKEANEEVVSFSFDDKNGEWCQFALEYDITVPKIIMLEHVEAICRSTTVQFIPGIESATYIKERNDEPYVHTDGCNLLAIRDYQHILDPTRVFTNDIGAMLAHYGVEAARATIMREMSSVFSGHGISVDNRHINLIADYMTRGGGFTPFSRTGMKGSVSPFMKMSFETTVAFLKEAVLECDWDTLRNPSARLVAGRTATVGTGNIDVLMPIGQ